MQLFVDSGGWIALSAKRDRYYLAASQAMARLERQPLQLITSDYVLDESLTHTQKAFGHQNAVRLGKWLTQAPNIKIMPVDEQVWSAAWEMFQAYDDKEWSFTDCTSFTLMRRHNLSTAFAFDHHFVQAGFQLWPGAA